MKTSAQTKTKQLSYSYPLLNPQDRLLIWKRAAGILRHKRPDPLRELRKMRKEWDRNLKGIR